jgi:hypothetical protein
MYNFLRIPIQSSHKRANMNQNYLLAKNQYENKKADVFADFKVVDAGSNVPKKFMSKKA